VKYLLDTDHLSLFVQKHPMVVANVAAHRTETLSISVVTVEEQLLGWLAEVRKTRIRNKQEAVYRRMASCVQDLSGWSVVPYTVPDMQRFDALVRLRINIGRNDMKIAAIALQEGATVATRNVIDFSRVPGLSIVDWSK
jgi:tRNA(fMet)-specific endonuclease VapC